MFTKSVCLTGGVESPAAVSVGAIHMRRPAAEGSGPA